MPSERDKHKYMPWTFHHGAWFYRVPRRVRAEWNNKYWFKLGVTEREAFKTWYERLGDDADPEEGELNYSTMADLFTSYERERLPLLAESTQASYREYLKVLRRAFSRMRPKDVLAPAIYAYMDRRKDRPASANREVSVLIKVMDQGVRKGAVTQNLIRGQIERFPEKPRERLPTHDELDDFTNDAHPFLKGYVALKRICGVRQGRLLEIDLAEQWDGKRLFVPKAKRGKDVYYSGWMLETVMEYILYQRGAQRLARGRLFINTQGHPVTKSGFSSMWQRQMKKYVKAGGVKFNEHDIRAFVASELDDDLERASKLLGHSDSRTTRRIYQRKAVEVEVLGG